MTMKITSITDKRITLETEKIGYVQLSKFSPDFDHGLYRNRPWHIVTFGRNFATVEECLLFLKQVEDNWQEEEEGEEYKEWKGTSHAEMTHSFLSMEADLENCP